MRNSLDSKERALGETYHQFYDHDVNHDFIKLEWVGDHYEVTNGRHRVWMAKQMGLRHMPAMVSAPDEATLQRLRAEGERIAAGEYPKRGSTPIWERTSPQQRQRPEREDGRDKGWDEKFTTADAVGDNNFHRKGRDAKSVMRQRSLGSLTERRLMKCTENGSVSLVVISRKDKMHLCGGEGVKENSLWIGIAIVEEVMSKWSKRKSLG